jgi:hypothetical protein
MKKSTRTTITIFIPLLILIVVVAVYYLKQPDDIQNKKSDYKLSSIELNREFLRNDSASNAKYQRKVIEVTGKVANIKKSEMHGVIITLDDPMMGIKCVMDSTVKELPARIEIGTPVSIKGVCVGSDQLIGVMMNQCVLAEK